MGDISIAGSSMFPPKESKYFEKLDI